MKRPLGILSLFSLALLVSAPFVDAAETASARERSNTGEAI